MSLRTVLFNSLRGVAICTILYGCGTGNGGQDQIKPGSKLAEAQNCIACHPNPSSPGTGNSIITEWKASVHNTKDGAGCRDCHEPINHPANDCARCHNGGALSGVDEIQRNPDKTGKCLKCHNSTFGYHGEFNPLTYAGIPMDLQQAHFNNMTGIAYPGSFVSSRYLYRAGISEGACRKCHNPHDVSSNIRYNRDWSRSAHGSTPGLPDAFLNDFRAKARDEYDFKTTGTTVPASQAMSDNTNGKYDSCVRCHTTTGYINYVSSGFSDLRPFADRPENVRTMNDYITLPSTTFSKLRGKLSPDISKELTNCDACHDNGAGVSYGFKLRRVPQVTSFYNISSKSGTSMNGGATPVGGGASVGGKIVNFGLTYPDVGASNMCVVCHSGRTTGVEIKMMDARGLEYDKTQGRITNHFRGAAEMLFRPKDKNGNALGMGFEFYSSGSAKPQGYDNVAFTHNIIGTTLTNPLRSPEGTKGMTADNRGYGPCIGCHLNLKDSLSGAQTSHTFLPVNREASSTYRNSATAPADPITGTVSKSCAVCHTQSNGEVEWEATGADPATGSPYQLLELQKQQFKAAAKAFGRLMAFAVDSRTTRTWSDSEGRPGTPSNWYGSNTSGARVQPWLRTSTLPDNSTKPINMLLKDGSTVNGLDYYILGAQFTDPLTGKAFPLRNATYTMGAIYNFFMLYYDPGAFAHNRRYVKRLMFDSMDWLDDGKLNKSVCDPTVRYQRADQTVNPRQYMSLNLYGGGLVGENDVFTWLTAGSNPLTANELKQASFYICGSVATSYNADGTIKAFTADHRPAP